MHTGTGLITLAVGFMPMNRCCMLIMRDGCARIIMRVRIIAKAGADIFTSCSEWRVMVVFLEELRKDDVRLATGQGRVVEMGECDWSMRQSFGSFDSELLTTDINVNDLVYLSTPPSHLQYT